MKRNIFCTLFDKNYLFRGLAMHRSLLRFSPEAELWILCMDSEVFILLQKMQLKGVTLIAHQEFENEEMRRIKQERTVSEYCWTCASVFTSYVMDKNLGAASVTYLDSDLYFFSSPEPLFEELGDKSVLIMPHNYAPEFAYLEKRSGKYNVAFIIFKQNEEAKECLFRWKNQCMEWCFNRYEDGKFGDQLYLDEWPERYPFVVVTRNAGADVAPWNISYMNIEEKNNVPYINKVPLIFYHFHSLKMYTGEKFRLFHASYSISSIAKKLIYTPYLQEIKQIAKDVAQIDPDYRYGFDRMSPPHERVLYFFESAVRLVVNRITKYHVQYEKKR